MEGHLQILCVFSSLSQTPVESAINIFYPADEESALTLNVSQYCSRCRQIRGIAFKRSSCIPNYPALREEEDSAGETLVSSINLWSSADLTG
jgi:hypothetical protein